MKKVPALFGSSTFIRLFCNRSLVEVSLSSGIEGGNIGKSYLSTNIGMEKFIRFIRSYSIRERIEQ